MAECIARELRPEVLSQGKPGERFHTVRTLCERFEATAPTIRGALKILEREGLIDIWPGCGVFVRDPIDRTQHVGVLVETDLGDLQCSFFHMRTISTLLRFFRGRETAARLYLGHRRAVEEPWKPTCSEFLDSVARQQLSGVVAVATHPHREWMEALERDGVPVVGTGAPYPNRAGFDPTMVIREGVGRLLELGRRRIAWLGWKEFLMGQPDRDELRVIFETMLQQSGAAVRREWIRRDIPPNLAGAGWEEFREIWSGGTEKPDGLLVTDDVLFQDAVPAITGLGIRVPEDLAVVCQTSKGSRFHCPFPIDRLEDDPDKRAETCGEMLLQLMRNEKVATPQVMLDFHLIEAATTKSKATPATTRA